MRTLTLSLILGWSAAGALIAASAGEPAKAPEETKIVALTDEQVKAEQAKETAEQKKLRAELAGVKGTVILFDAGGDNWAMLKGRNNQLFSMNGDGSGLKMLPTEDKGGSYPHLSPDGKRVVFQRYEKLSKEELAALPCDPAHPISDWTKRTLGKDASFIWTMNLDGSKAERLAQGSLPHWAPNGKVVAYNVATTSNRRMQPALFDLEKKSEKVLELPGVKTTWYPSFSPDGKWLQLGNGAGTYVPMNEGCTDLAEGGKPVQWTGSHLCNQEISKDGKWNIWVVDIKEDSWLRYGPFTPGTPAAARDCDLGWPRGGSGNYFPDFSPCGKYFVYAHWSTVPSPDGRPSLYPSGAEGRSDLYAARFPADGVSVRITWLNGSCANPHWTGVPAAPERK